VRGLPLDAAGLVEMVEELIDLFSRHPRRFVRLAMDTGADGVGPGGRTIESHAFATACLAVATAIRLGWSRGDALHCGLAAILADAGMHLIRTEIRGASRPLIDVETARVQKHAAMSALLALEIQGLAEAVPMIVLQHHEREDARGYPRFLHALQIHDAARVLAACDCFAAMLAERPHRPAMAATDAVREVWGLAQQGSLRQDVVEALMEISFDMQRVEEEREAGEPRRRAA
jgi:HD-GYP domain-containing protein (c-di-GMP phosphodiesterase class II)